MRIPLSALEPVAIVLDEIQVEGDLRFTGVDLESGARITVLIERAPADPAPPAGDTREAHGLVLVLSMESLLAQQ